MIRRSRAGDYSLGRTNTCSSSERIGWPHLCLLLLTKNYHCGRPPVWSHPVYSRFSSIPRPIAVLGVSVPFSFPSSFPPFGIDRFKGLDLRFSQFGYPTTTTWCPTRLVLFPDVDDPTTDRKKEEWERRGGWGGGSTKIWLSIERARTKRHQMHEQD